MREPNRPLTGRAILCVLMSLAIPQAMIAETVTVPFGTAVYCELDQRVTSKNKEWSEGDVVRAHVWRDVRVDGRVVVKAGTPVMVRVSKLQKSRIAGRKGSLELEALNVVAVDNVDISLDGGYDKSGKGKVGLTVALAALVFVPLIFMKGKQAILEPGIIFDSMVRNPTKVEVESSGARPLLQMIETLTVEILYDDIDMDADTILLSFRIQSDEAYSAVEIVAINGDRISPTITLTLQSEIEEGEVVAVTPWKPLTKKLARGMNRLTMKAGEETVEVLLEIEL